jgi:7,8-dihydropterin-6-yl-methyl-4-(beta-D-ribofuranosyl)aminobenzene 5'-phosphate synthase
MITVIYDNNPVDGSLVADWGFACVIDGLEKKVLFDTGAKGDVLLQNAAALGVQLSDVDALVLSHDHWDHAGGLPEAVATAPDMQVYMPAVFPQDLKQTVTDAGASLVETDASAPICDGAFTTRVLTGAIPEQGLCLQTEKGVVLITGCAHPGIVEMVRAAKDAAAGNVYAALGGFHTRDASEDEIAGIVDELRSLGVERVGPCHCSGDLSRTVMKRMLGDAYIDLSVGTRLPLPC